MILYKNEILSKEKTTMPKRGANEQNHHAVMIVKRTAGCTENQANWLWANRQHYIS